MEELEKQTLRSCCSAVVQLLDIGAVLPHLIANHMLTVENRIFLTCRSKSQQEKAEYLVYILPRKCQGWFVRFLDCLNLSTEGTAHADLAQKLKVHLEDLREINTSKQKLVGECAAANEVTMASSDGREEVHLFVYLAMHFKTSYFFIYVYRR